MRARRPLAAPLSHRLPAQPAAACARAMRLAVHPTLFVPHCHWYPFVNTTPQVIDFCREKGVDFVMVGPEQPLVEGLVDALTAAGITAFGPTAAAAQLEGSKAFMKNICR